MYKSKLVKFGAIALVLGCVAVGCGDKKEDNPTKNANNTNTTTVADKVVENVKETTGKTEPNNDLDELVKNCLNDELDCCPYGIMSAITDAGYDENFAESYVNDLDIDWTEYAKKIVEYNVKLYQSEYYVRTLLENSYGFSRDVIDETLDEMSIDFTEVCYDYMYWKCSGQYPTDETEIERLKKSCQNSKFTDSQIDAAIAKLAENCK